MATPEAMSSAAMAPPAGTGALSIADAQPAEDAYASSQPETSPRPGPSHHSAAADSSQLGAGNEAAEAAEPSRPQPQDGQLVNVSAAPPQLTRLSGTGVDLFSVPPSAIPATGVYGMPTEAFQFRDLDSGRTFYMDKRWWIKDVDTGRVFVLEPQEPGGASSSSAAGAASTGTPPLRVSDLLSGQALSLTEFEEAMGYSRAAPAAEPAFDTSSSAEEGPGTGQQMAQRGLASLSMAAQASATWMRDRASAMADRVQASRRHDGAVHAVHAGSPSDHSSPSSPTHAAAADGQGLPIRVQVSRKPYKELTDLRLVQQVPAHEGVVWTMRFSRTGRYLASAGQDSVVKVWEIVPGRGSAAGTAAGPFSGTGSGPEGGASGSGLLPSSGFDSKREGQAVERSADPSSGGASPVSPSYDSGSGGSGGVTYGVPVLRAQPYRTYRGHKQDILDLAWSKTNFLLSASMDKTVRLWHVSMDECLRVFKHSDFVTAIDFHPSDDKHFVSGSIDGKVRLWNVPEQRVVSWQDVHDMVTAVGYARDGRRAVVGTMRGKCRFYGAGDKTGLEYEAQLDVKNKRGQHARGKKVTGAQFAPSSSAASGSGGSRLLITSNDSRIRLYDGYVLKAKYKGHTNKSTQIKASFSPRGDYIVCGSDDGHVYVWSTRKGELPGSPQPEKKANEEEESDPGAPAAKEKNASYECFQAAGDIVTVALFAPQSTHRLEEVGSPGAGGAAAATAYGQVLVTAGYGGEIKIYENCGLPQWL